MLDLPLLRILYIYWIGGFLKQNGDLKEKQRKKHMKIPRYVDKKGTVLKVSFPLILFPRKVYQGIISHLVPIL